MITIPQSTAFLVVFKAYLASDHVTEATGKTIAITISKNGGAFGNPAAGALNATEISSGWYKASLGTGDTDTLGPLAIRGAVALIDDVGICHQVVSATTGGLTNLDAAISSIPTANANADALLDRAAGVETGITPRQYLRVSLAAMAGKADGLAGATVHYRDQADSKNRITATVDSDGNRSAVTLDAS
jgi:hypothetical protein